MSDVEELKNEIVSLHAETLALQFILSGILNEICDEFPAIIPRILKGFDSAANVAESMSIQRGKASGHLPETLEIIEQLRTSIQGKQKPRREV